MGFVLQELVDLIVEELVELQVIVELVLGLVLDQMEEFLVEQEELVLFYDVFDLVQKFDEMSVIVEEVFQVRVLFVLV